MIISFTGAHGSGKTTLAQRVSESTGLPFYPSRAAEVHRALGFTGSQHLDFADRLRVQHGILTMWSYDFATARKTGGVFDRTPADFLTYTLADVNRGSQIDQDSVQRYQADCLFALGHCDHLLLVEPLTHNLTSRGTDKPDTDNIAFVQHYHFLLRGILQQHASAYMRIGQGTVEQRLGIVMQYLEAMFDQKAASASKATQIGAVENATGNIH